MMMFLSGLLWISGMTQEKNRAVKSVFLISSIDFGTELFGLPVKV